MNLELIENKLKLNLKKPLPGRECQYLMAASDRTGQFKNPVTDNQKKDAGVLILLYEKSNTAYTVLIKRPNYNGVHSGQIAFPGGKFEKVDQSIIATALRESNEEIGIIPSDVEIIGQLTPLHIPVSNIEVFPIIGLMRQIPNFLLDNKEVEYTIEVALKDLLDPNNKKTKKIEIHKQKVIAPYFDIQNEMIWGATAMIINELTCLLN